MNNQGPLVSVIIPTYNEATYVGRLLDALCVQAYKPIEVIVSDAESKDEIRQVVESYKDKLSIQLVTSPPKGPGAGRNEGAKNAQGEWLLFLDADVDLDDANFITTLVMGATNKQWQTASAKTVVCDATIFERFGTRVNYLYTKMLAHTKHPVAAGWCILTKRKLFEDNHGFNEKIQFGEDYDYVSRVGSSGFGFVDETYYYMDLRRARKEGWRFVYKGFANEVYRLTHGFNLEKNPYDYEFGKHDKRKTD